MKANSQKDSNITGGDKQDKRMIFDGYIIEYQECCNSYRHIYTTIWASAVAFFAIAAAILAFGANIIKTISIEIQIVAIIPIIFWYFGIFKPMDSYGDTRSNRQEKIEKELEILVPGLCMKHAQDFRKKMENKITVSKAMKFLGYFSTLYLLILLLRLINRVHIN